MDTTDTMFPLTTVRRALGGHPSVSLEPFGKKKNTGERVVCEAEPNTTSIKMKLLRHRKTKPPCSTAGVGSPPGLSHSSAAPLPQLMHETPPVLSPAPAQVPAPVLGVGTATVRFCLAALASCIGEACSYPLDTIKPGGLLKNTTPCNLFDLDFCLKPAIHKYQHSNHC